MVDVAYPNGGTASRLFVWLVILLLLGLSGVAIAYTVKNRLKAGADEVTTATKQNNPVVPVEPKTGSTVSYTLDHPTDRSDLHFEFSVHASPPAKNSERFRLIVRDSSTKTIVAESDYNQFLADRKVIDNENRVFTVSLDELQLLSTTSHQASPHLPLVHDHDYEWQVFYWDGPFESSRQGDPGQIAFIDNHAPKTPAVVFHYTNPKQSKPALTITSAHAGGIFDLDLNQANTAQPWITFTTNPNLLYRAVLFAVDDSGQRSAVRQTIGGYITPSGESGSGQFRLADVQAVPGQTSSLVDGGKYELVLYGLDKRLLNELTAAKNTFPTDNQFDWTTSVADQFAETSGPIRLTYHDRAKNLVLTVPNDGRFLDARHLSATISTPDYQQVDQLQITIAPVFNETVGNIATTFKQATMNQETFTYTQDEHSQQILSAGNYQLVVQLHLKDTGSTLEKSVRINLANSLQ